MLKLKKVAVTGGLSCGKSLVCRLLKECGAYVVSADEIVHTLLSSDANLIQAVVKLLGAGILVDNKISRTRVAEIAFADPNLLQGLESLLHPLVYQEIEKEFQQQKDRPAPPPLFVAEIPLLFETVKQKDFHNTVAVVADPELCYERFSEATGQFHEDFNKRTARQLTQLEKAVLADYVIMNSSTQKELQSIIQELYNELVTSGSQESGARSQ